MRKFKPRIDLTRDFASGLWGEGLGLNSFSDLCNANSFSDLCNPNLFSDLSIAAIKTSYLIMNRNNNIGADYTSQTLNELIRFAHSLDRL